MKEILFIAAMVIIGGVAAKYMWLSQKDRAGTVQPPAPSEMQSIKRIMPSREDILALNWPVSTKNWSEEELRGHWPVYEYVDYDIHGYVRVVDSVEIYQYGDEFIIRDATTKKDIGRISGNKVFNGALKWEGKLTGFHPLVNDILRKAYIFVEECCNDAKDPEFRLYEIGFDNSNPHIIAATGEGIGALRFSPDKTLLSFMAPADINIGGNNRVSDFYVIDLLDTNTSFYFIIPGDDKRDDFVAVNNLQKSDSSIYNFVGAFRIIDENIIEFTRFYAQGADIDGYTQISDKELWQYDKRTGEYTLIQTIPLTK